MESIKSYTSIAKGKTRSGENTGVRDSGGIKQTLPTASTKQSEQAARSESIHSSSPFRTVTHEPPYYLDFELEKLDTYMHITETCAGKSFTDTALVGMDIDGNFTFHKKKSDKNKNHLTRLSATMTHYLHRHSEIEALLCEVTLKRSHIPDFFNVKLIKEFIALKMETSIIHELYAYELKLLRYCLLGEGNEIDVLEYCNRIYSVFVSQWGIKADNHDFFWNYIKNFFQRYAADFQGKHKEKRAFHAVEFAMKNVMGCDHCQRLVDLSDDTQSKDQASVLDVESASGHERQLGAAVAGEAAVTQLMATMTALDIQEKGAPGEVESHCYKGARPKSLQSRQKYYHAVPQAESCDAGKILTEEILNEENALKPVFDHAHLLEKISRESGSDNAFVCMNKNGGISFENKLNEGNNKSKSADFGYSMQEYEVWARVVFDFFHSRHDFYKREFKNIKRERMQVRTCRSVLNHYEKHPYSSVLRTTFLLFKAVQEGRHIKAEQFSGLLGRMISTFVKYEDGVNQSGSLATIAESGKVFHFFESAFKRCQRMQPEWQTELTIVRDHFNNSLKELGIDQRLS